MDGRIRTHNETLHSLAKPLRVTLTRPTYQKRCRGTSRCYQKPRNAGAAAAHRQDRIDKAHASRPQLTGGTQSPSPTAKRKPFPCRGSAGPARNGPARRHPSAGRAASRRPPGSRQDGTVCHRSPAPSHARTRASGGRAGSLPSRLRPGRRHTAGPNGRSQARHAHQPLEAGTRTTPARCSLRQQVRLVRAVREAERDVRRGRAHGRWRELKATCVRAPGRVESCLA